MMTPCAIVVYPRRGWRLRPAPPLHRATLGRILAWKHGRGLRAALPLDAPLAAPYLLGLKAVESADNRRALRGMANDSYGSSLVRRRSGSSGAWQRMRSAWGGSF
jgi:hypothetical protein